MLGFNGSGKTTTFKTITNEKLMNSGNISTLNMDVKKDIGKLKKQVGYCPQTNALFDHLTTYEMVDYYRKLKLENVNVIVKY